MNNIQLHDTNNNLPERKVDAWMQAYKLAEMMSKSNIIPVAYQDKPSNIFIVMQTALRMDLDPLYVMQNSDVIGGKIRFSSAFTIALANKSGELDSPICYNVSGTGDRMEVTAYATLKKGDRIEFTISMAQAIAEGWATKTGNKYKNLPQLMLMYRAAVFLIRTHLPQVLLSSHTSEEERDIIDHKEQNISHQKLPVNRISSLKSIAQDKTDKININIIDSRSDELELIDRTESEETTEDSSSVYDAPQSNHLRMLVDELRSLIVSKQVSSEVVEKWLDKAKVDDISELNLEQLTACINKINI